MPKKTILLADDDEHVCKVLTAILADHGYEVEAVFDGKNALARMRAAPTSLLILDMVMPVVDGWKVLAEKAIDNSLQSIPVIILTALGVASAEWAANLGAVALIRKPIDIERLLACVRSALER